MEINVLAATGFSVAAVLFALLSALMMIVWRDRPKAALIALASVATTIWGVAQAAGSLGHIESPAAMTFADLARILAWILLLASIHRGIESLSSTPLIPRSYAVAFVAGSVLLGGYLALEVPTSPVTIISVTAMAILLAIALSLAERIFNSVQFDSQSGLKYLCIGIGGMIAYDLVKLVADALNAAPVADIRAAWGYVFAMLAFPIGLAAQRSFVLSVDGPFPQQVVFRSFVLIGIGLFFLVMILTDLYIRSFAGSWGDVLRIGILAFTVTTLAVLAASPTIRARFRVFLTKSFFEYKYDYRKEWLRFIGTLSQSELDNMANTAVRAVAQIVNSPGGVVWVREQDDRYYLPVGAWGVDLPVMASLDADSRLIRFLEKRQWVIDLNEMRSFPARYEGLVVEPWIKDRDDWWLIVPLFLSDRPFGFIVLTKPKIVPSLNFEDHDLLRTVGRHVATHIDQAQSDRRLAESQQFGTYNRLTAFLMHDLNNLIAQQSLVVKNAERFRKNPDFVDDAIDTIAHSVARMRRLMEQLSTVSEVPRDRPVELVEILERAVNRCDQFRPIPELKPGSADSITVRADAERLTTVAEHLIRNAQDATDESGKILIDTDATDSVATFSIQDTGCGMTPDFIRERLFRPFDSTKGSQSMGIGAYQAREYIRQLGGQIEVTSTPGAGTRFDVRLPIE